MDGDPSSATPPKARVDPLDPDDNWKDHIVRLYGKKRLDITLVGVLWMQLCQMDVSKLFTDKQLEFDQFETYLLEALVTTQTFDRDHVLLTKM